jgi:uncharacterized protein
MMALRVALSFLTLSFCHTACLAESSVWVVQFKDQVVYLGGTIHVLRPQDYPLPVEFDAAYANSEAIVFETDIGRLEDPETQEVMRNILRYDDGRTLSRVLSPEAYSALEQQSQAMGVSLSRFEPFRPIMVLLGLLAVELERVGVSAQGVDEHFHAKALTDGKSIGILETVESQMKVLAAMGEGQESSFVTHGVEELTETQGMLGDAITAWRVGNEKRLADALLERTKRDYPGLYRSLIVQRNGDWLPKVKGLFTKRGREFVLVGVAHLVGEDGLLRQLEHGGYQVRQLKPGGIEWGG